MALLRFPGKDKFVTLFFLTEAKGIFYKNLLLLFSFLLLSAVSIYSQTSLFQTSGPNALGNDGSGAEFGMKFRSTQSGFITAIRYYKPSGTTGTHTGHLWTSGGTLLASTTFTGETSSGWQQAPLSIPISINANTTYVVSYFSPSGDYCVTNPYFTSTITNGSLRGLANGEDGPNGLYRYTSASAFPNSNYQSSNYWVDVVFTVSTGPDVTAPLITTVSPTNGATGISVGASVEVTFNEGMNASTITSSTFELRNSSNTLVPATVAYSSGSLSATLTPSSSLSSSTAYTATVKGGVSGVKDVTGNALSADYTWSFTTAAPPPNEGNGGPILVISTSSNPFSRYAVEILRAEGLNEFLAMDISSVNSTVLNNYDVVVLGEITVTAAQVTLLTNWVNAGGKLVAFRPSSLLAPLMGLSTSSGTLSDRYLLINTASGPGAGIVNQTIQYHGPANLHTLNGATSIATLYSNATTATSNPAVTTINVGSNGGRAIAFTYDLARSIVYTRQGNPALAGQETDNAAPQAIRPDDMFFPSYLDMNKVAIPQADEQQRLLANIIIQSNLAKKPLPRFWYMPKRNKAAVIFALDDHGTASGTKDVFDKMIANSPSGCSIDDWECLRSTAWVYVGIPITGAQANTYNSQGFEMGVHVQNNCQNFTSFANLDAVYNTQFQQFRSAYPGLPLQTTHRFHCLIWSDWATQAKVELSRGVRFSLDYYYWPSSWVAGRPGLFTGSGMPMRFADSDGSMLDIYQGVSNLVNENGNNYSTDVNTLLDNALGSQGYYGFFGAHDDYTNTSFSNTIIASAKARNVPIISAKQMLTWLDGRNASYFGTMTWSNNQLTVPITALSGARNLNCMLPYNSASGGIISSITRNGNPLSFTTQTIKGMQYAFFDVTIGTGTYVATYTSSGSVAPSVTTHPTTQTVCAGSNVTFTSAASGTPTPTVQWQVSTNGGTSWLNISGATSSTLTFAVTTADNNERYRAVWTNSQSTANSNAAILTVNALPSAPTVNVVNNCGNSVLTANGFTGSLLWSTAATTSSITVTAAGTYTVTQTVNGCISSAGSGVATPNSIPSAPTVSVADNCGNSVLTANGFTGSLLWSNGATTSSITVTTAGTYTVTQTVNGCISAAGNGVAAPKAIPSAPSVSVENNCGSSVLTATGVSGTLLWSNGATTSSITVATAGTYTVTQTVNGCISAAGNGVAVPKAIPSAPTVSVENNCGNSVLTATGVSGTLLWSNGATTTSITVTTGGTYTVTQTVNGCTSTAGSGVAAPKAIPSAASVSVADNCGNSVLTATGFTGSLLWSTGATTSSITVITGGTYTVTQAVNGCTSIAGSAVAEPKTTPPAPIVSVIDNCGNSVLTATNFAGSLLWNTSETTASITVATGGTYTVTQAVNGCTSTTGSGLATPKVIPSAPLVSVSDNCGNSVLTATNFTGSLLWSTGETTESITVTTGGTYTVTQTIDGCVSAEGSGVAVPKAIPSVPAVQVSDNCGNSVLTVTNITGTLLWSTGETTSSITVTTGGTYTVTQTIDGCVSAEGSGVAVPKAIPSVPAVQVSDNCGNSVLTVTNITGTLLWSTGETTSSITVTTGGTYTVTQTIDGCISAEGSGVASPKIIPSAPIVTVVNNCGNSILTATNYTGALLWSNGATTSSITVTTGGVYTVTQTIDDCVSAGGSATATPKAIPVAPIVLVSNNCGSSVLTAGNYTGTLLWNTGATTPSIIVSAGGVYSVTQTVNGCTGTAGTGTAEPLVLASAPSVSVVNNCNNSVLTAGSYTGTLLWSTGATTASITVTVPGTYTVVQIVDGCSGNVANGVAAPLSSTIAAPSVTVTNNCGNSVLTAGNYTGTLLWSTGETTESITVTTGGTFTVAQIIDGCSGVQGSGIASPKAIPAAPLVNVTDNCGSSILTAKGYTGSLLWSTGEATESITVTTAGTYTVTQIVDECISAEGSGTSAPKPIPSAPTVSVVNNCGNSILTASNYSGSLLWSTGETTESIMVTNGGTYTVTQNVNGCVGTEGSGVASPIAPPPSPVVNVVDNCGTSTLTATGYSGTLLWSTGETTESITVTTGGTYTVTQSVNECVSLAGSGTASPKAIPSAPTVNVVDNCGTSTLTAVGYTGSLIWSTGAITESITVATGGTYTVTQTVNGCISGEGSGTSAPKPIPSAPSTSVVNNCNNSVLTATDFSGSLLWSTGETTPSITVAIGGTYTVTQTVNDCISASGSGIAEPTSTLIPAPTVTVVNNCGSSTLTASNYTGSILWSTGETTASITVTTGGTYTVYQIIEDCQGMPGSAVAAPKAIPSAPIVTVVNNCGSSTLTASNYTGSLIWSTGEATASITVITGGTYTVTQTIENCISTEGSGVASPASTVAPPTVTVVDDCGSSTLTATNYSGTLLWSNGDTTASITVTTGGTYTVNQTEGQCVSDNASAVAAPKTIPSAPTVSVVNSCDNSVLTASNFTGSLLWSTGETTASITVTAPGTYTVTQTINNCLSPLGSGVATPRTGSSIKPTIIASGATTFCQGGSVTLTSSLASGNLWSNGATTNSIVVTSSGSYTVQDANAGTCAVASDPVVVTVSPGVAGTISVLSATLCENTAALVTFNAANGLLSGPYNLIINGVNYNNIVSGVPFVTTSTALPGTSLFAANSVPSSPLKNDGQALEVGMKFRVSANGVIRSIRFYKGSNNDASTYTLKLYQNSNRALLASVTFSNRTATGWQTVPLPTPVSVTAGTTYVVSYYSPSGNYANNLNYFTTARTNGGITGLANGTDGTNGIYRYGTGGGFPTSSYQSGNYWVDIVYATSSTMTLNLTSITNVSTNCTTTGNLSSVALQVVYCPPALARSVAQPEAVVEKEIIPKKLELGQNHPNPFESSTLLDFSLPGKGRVKLVLYDLNGRVVSELLNEVRDPGVYTIPVNKYALKAGIYYYRIEFNGEMIVKKMMIL